MSKVKITQAQAEFIEAFKKEYFFDNDEKVEIGTGFPMWAARALHNLMQFGFGSGLLDANDKEVSDDSFDKDGNFQHEQVPKLIKAIIDGYEVEGKHVVLFMEFSDKEFDEYRKLYYGFGINVTNKKSASWYDLDIEWEAKKVEELKAKGWEVEEL